MQSTWPVTGLTSAFKHFGFAAGSAGAAEAMPPASNDGSEHETGRHIHRHARHDALHDYSGFGWHGTAARKHLL